MSRLPSDRAGRVPPAGGMAQLVERLLCKQDVAGSNPATSTSVWIDEAPSVSGGDARRASPFAFSSRQLADSSRQLAVGICDLRFFDLRLHWAIWIFEDLIFVPSSPTWWQGDFVEIAAPMCGSEGSGRDAPPRHAR